MVSKHLAFFRKIISSVVTDTTAKAAFENGYRYGKGNAQAILKPETNSEVSQILAYCNKHNISVVAQGGNTGLTGASTPDTSGKQIILSTTLLNRGLLEIDTKNKTALVGVAVVLDALNKKLAKHNLTLPIDIGSSGSCNIGGLIATNAAGTRAGRYGNTKSQTESISVILADGTAQEDIATKPSQSSSKLLQDNSKIDLLNPFIGSQGWLGIITSATMKLVDLPKQSASLLVVPANDDAVLQIREYFEEKHGDEFTAFEGMSDSALHLVSKHIPKSPYLFEGDDDKKPEHDYVLLIELASEKTDISLQDEIDEAFMDLFQLGLVITGRSDKPELFWHQRHHISEALKLEGQIIATDICVPQDRLSEFRIYTTKALEKKYPFVIATSFGHEMLGAAHFNIIWPKNKPLSAEEKSQLQDFIYDIAVNKFDGTFSAEHGIGPHNQKAYGRYTDKIIKEKSAELKQKYDPNRILNPNISY